MVEERYEIRGKIGQGGVGVVYKAYDTQLRREVAIKRVLADELDGDQENATKNLLKEATALSSVQHPHICTVYDAGLDDDGPFVVMELINGKTLDEMVERGSLTYEDFREVAIQSQEAMIAAQELNLVHRDLKPSNVMVSWLPSGRFQIKLVDFGLAKFSAKPSLQTIDHGDAVFGSIFFMAPEQFERTPLDQRTDMYSLGAMFYYSLTGNYPFDGDTAPQVMASHLQNSVIPLQQVRPDLPVWLCEWVMWHIQRDMDHRPESALLALQKFLDDESGISQGAVEQTPQLGGPAAPILRKVITGPQTIRPASEITGPLSIQSPAAAFAVNASTAPQPILSPNGMPGPGTTPIATQPSGNIGAALVDTSAVISPDTGNTVIPALEAPPEKPINKTKVIVIGSMLAIALIITCLFIFGASKKQNHQDAYSVLIKDIESKKTLSVTKAELNTLLISMVKNSIKDKIGGYTAMSKSQAKDGSFSPTLEIAKFIIIPGQDIKDESMKNIFLAIHRNPNHDIEAHKLLLKYALNNPDKPHTAQAINRMKKFADDSFIKSLLSIYEITTKIATRASCANTLTEIIKRSNSKSSIAANIITKYNAAWDEDKKLAYLRLLGTTGSKEALEILYEALDHDEIKFRMSAFKALSTSPTMEPFDAMIKVYVEEKSETHLSKYRKDIFNLFKSNDNLSDQKKTENWMKMFESSPTERSSKHVIAELSGINTELAGTLLKKIIASPDQNANIKEYATERLKRRGK
jgi:serine/threonine protein kinase